MFWRTWTKEQCSRCLIEYKKKEQCLARNEHGAIAFYAYAVLNLEDEPELHQPGGPNILKSVAPSTNIVF
jgi:hypothetical protein